MGKFPGAKIRIESDFHFPAMGESAADTSGGGPADTSASVDEESNADSSSSGAVSFARMLRKPSASSSSNAPAQPAKPKTSAVAGPVMTVLRRRRDSDSEPEPEGYVPPPPQVNAAEGFRNVISCLDV